MNITVARFLLENNVYKDCGMVRIPTVYYDQIMDALKEPEAMKMSIEEWAEDFKGFINELQMPRDDYKGIMAYIDDGLKLMKKQEAMKWISVDDKLPTYAELQTGQVLILFEDGCVCSAEFDECIEGESMFGTWRQNFDPVTLGATDSDWIPFENVTHWMPMPEFPERKDTKDGV